MPTRTLFTLLLIVIFELVAKTGQAKPRPGYSFGAFMGMTMSELSARYRTTRDARGWKVEYMPRNDGHTFESVRWGYKYHGDDDTSMRFTLRDGHVITIVSVNYDEDGNNFNMMESLLNRNLTALSENEWFDKANQTIWFLHQDPRSYMVIVHYKPAFRQSSPKH